MPRINRVLILDGYTDEPAGFGVPPYIDIYPRYIAGAIWSVNKSITIHYLTVDEARNNVTEFIRRANTYDLVVVIAGAVVPGRYLGGTPITLQELQSWFKLINKPFKVLVGAAARWGIGNIGGSVAALPRTVKQNFDVIVTGEPEAYVYELVKYGEERARPWAIIDDEYLEPVSRFAVLGAKITKQHPNYGYNLIAEIETYRGCPRWISGGCSFCVTKLYGKPRLRRVNDIVREIESLYMHGVKHFRLGRQADILVYGSKELSTEEWPKPSPDELERLLYGIRAAAPGLFTLHIDNVNPGTIVRHERESIKALKVIIKYHTPGDVAALGIETADPKVVKLNNLKTYPDESLKAIELVSKLGSQRGYNGLPELLPGINFVLGLVGESTLTYKLNEEFIEKLYSKRILVRRINVRKVLVLPGTQLYKYGTRFIDRYRMLAKRFEKVVLRYSRLFLQQVVPRGTVLRYAYIEYYNPGLGVTFARQAGSYPIVVEIPCMLQPPRVIDVYVYSHSARSVRGIPLPLNPNTSALTIIAKIVGESLAQKIALNKPFRNNYEIQRAIGDKAAFFSINGYTCKPS